MLKINVSSVKTKLTDFLINEITKTGFNKGVIGLSGGVDSSVVTYLTADALGKENVLSVIMPYKTSSPESLADAKLVASEAGVKSEIIDLTPIADKYIKKRQEINKIRRGNILARLRMIILYDISARERALVIGTSNKTEILLGYGTIYGDTACAINPLGDLYKTQVLRLAKYLGVPREIINKKPTADLWQGQTDEDELGFLYRDVDRLLYYMIDEKRNESALIKLGFRKDFIDNVKQLIKLNRFKRRLPKIAKLAGIK